MSLLENEAMSAHLIWQYTAVFYLGSRVGEVVREPPCLCWVKFVIGFLPCAKMFSFGTLVLPCFKRGHFKIVYFDRDSVNEQPLSV